MEEREERRMRGERETKIKDRDKAGQRGPPDKKWERLLKGNRWQENEQRALVLEMKRQGQGRNVTRGRPGSYFFYPSQERTGMSVGSV